MRARTRPARPPSRAALGLDIGAGSIRAAIVDSAGNLHAAGRAPTPPGGDPQRLAATAADLATRVAAEARAAPPIAGVALPGIRDASGAVLRRAVNLPRLEGLNVRKLLEQALQRPVRLETDANAAGWAQWHALRPRPARFAYLSIGSGVGGCVILDGRIVRHTHDGPGHLGHLVVDAGRRAPRCRCGATGCLEALLGGRSARRLVSDSSRRARASRALALGLLQLAHLYAPSLIALGGGAIEHCPRLLAGAREAFDALGSRLVPAGIAIRPAALPGEAAGTIGAALLALRA